jgi:hypothetical protein
MAINSLKFAGLFSPTRIQYADFSDAATGTYTDGNGVDWKYKTYNSSGTLTISQLGIIEVTVVAGGGGGASGGNFYGGAGGGAGGLILDEKIYVDTIGTYSVTVGAGGAGGAAGGSGAVGASGSQSLIQSMVPGVNGGGRGGNGLTGGGASGGSGGGNGNVGGTLTGIIRQGFSGGVWAGGGALGAGGSVGSPGAGLVSVFTGSSVTLAQGGDRVATPTNAAANSGFGGNGQFDGATSRTGGNGGSGVIIVRVRTN